MITIIIEAAPSFRVDQGIHYLKRRRSLDAKWVATPGKDNVAGSFCETWQVVCVVGVGRLCYKKRIATCGFCMRDCEGLVEGNEGKSEMEIGGRKRLFLNVGLSLLKRGFAYLSVIVDDVVVLLEKCV